MKNFMIGFLLGFIFGFLCCAACVKNFIPKEDIAPKIALHLSKTSKTSITPQEVEKLFNKKD